MVSLLVGFSLIFVTQSTLSDYKVYVTQKRHEADLIVFKSESLAYAKNSETIWFSTTSKFLSDVSIRYVKNRHNADVIVYFTKNRNEARWTKKHRLVGKFLK